MDDSNELSVSLHCELFKHRTLGAMTSVTRRDDALNSSILRSATRGALIDDSTHIASKVECKAVLVARWAASIESLDGEARRMPRKDR